jgi:TRAP-type C4-dicarboxylate transport system substrate-binding protein
MKVKFIARSFFAHLVVALACGTAFAADPLENFKPKFDPSSAEYIYLLSNISHPAIAGTANGYHIRDEVWKRSNGRLFVDYRPLAQLGGEKDVINKLKMGAVQGMLCSSLTAQNIAPQLGVVNLPFVVDTFDKLEKFRNDAKLFGEFRQSTLPRGIMVADIVNYGTYGWATTVPVSSIKDAGNVNFRIAEAPINADIYKAWGLKFTVMPWPDVPQALQTGVIDGLDHTTIVCNLTKKFEIAKNFTEVNYAQGLFVHLMNKRWFDKLPVDLQKILMEVIEEESVKTRQATREQQDAQIAAAKANGVTFFPLSEEDKQTLIRKSAPVYEKWEKRIGQDFLNEMRSL